MEPNLGERAVKNIKYWAETKDKAENEKIKTELEDLQINDEPKDYGDPPDDDDDDDFKMKGKNEIKKKELK